MFLVSLILCQYQVALQPILWAQDVKWSLQKAFRRRSEDFQDASLKLYIFSLHPVSRGSIGCVYFWSNFAPPLIIKLSEWRCCMQDLKFSGSLLIVKNDRNFRCLISGEWDCPLSIDPKLVLGQPNDWNQKFM